MMMMMKNYFFTAFKEMRWGPLTSGRSMRQRALNENNSDDDDDDDDANDYERMIFMIILARCKNQQNSGCTILDEDDEKIGSNDS